MADSSSPRQVDAITAPARPDPKPAFAAPEAPAQAAKKRRMSRKWLLRVAIVVVLILPFAALGVGALALHQMYQPQLLHRTPITAVTPKVTPTSTTTK